jgi:O-antigen ligase
MSASLLGTSMIEPDGGISRLYVLPEIITRISYYVYLFMLLLFSFLGAKNVSQTLTFPAPMLVLAVPYFLLLFWSIVTSSEHVRYMIMFFSITFSPIGLVFLLKKSHIKIVAKFSIFVLSFLVFISALYSYFNISTHPRVAGIHNNPNLMGVWLVSLLAVVLYFQEYVKRVVVFWLVFGVSVLALFSGSRLGFGTLLLVLIPFVFKLKALPLFMLSSVAIISVYFMGTAGFNFRATDFDSAVSDSGRIFIWLRAFECISAEPLVGHGMLGAQNCVDIGNVHNSYLRVAVMLGLPLATTFFVFFFAFLAYVFILRVSPYIKFYFLGLPFAFFGEDYISGVASPFFPFFIFILALFLFDYKRISSYSSRMVKF